MTRRRASISTVMLTLLGMVVSACSNGSFQAPSSAAPVESNAQPYAGWETRPIAALAPERVGDLLAGRGAGYALAAELNHYPGPTHALELSSELALTDEQEKKIRETFAAMRREAQVLGQELVELEVELDGAFQTNSITASRLKALIEAIAEVEGALRNVHLKAHLDVTATLTADQVSRYDALRGYKGGNSEHNAPAGHGAH